MGTTRPKDIKGNDIVVGPWYWAQDRTLRILGAGRFAYVIGSGTLRFTMNGAGHQARSITLQRAILKRY